MTIRSFFLVASFSFILVSCLSNEEQTETEESVYPPSDSIQVVTVDTVSAQDIRLRKELLYDQYTLEDQYFYVNTKKDTIERAIQWEIIKEKLAQLENMKRDSLPWGVLQNYKNRNGESPLARNFIRDEYSLISDTLGVERYQAAALYFPTDSLVPERYGRDGTPVRILTWETDSNSSYYRIAPASIPGDWLAKKKQVKLLGDTLRFDHAVVVDVTNQSIVSLQNIDDEWLVRSINPATTGVHRPPYAQETPIGMYFMQEKKRKMIYLKDGSTETGGFAPYASRFTNGGYIHGIPTVHPNTSIIEYSRSLGTTPRSHMCVRNASSHAKFIYDNFPIFDTVIFVID